MYFYIITFIPIILTFLLYKLFNNDKFNYWKNKGINGPKPYPIVGNFGAAILGKESFDHFMKRNYEEFPNDKVVGLYKGTEPALLIRDPELIKHVLVKDFNVFTDRGVFPKESKNKFQYNLLFADGEKWRILRQKLTPLFTSGKLKNMVSLMTQCVDDYVSYVNYLVDNNIDHEIRSLINKYTLQVIGSCAFGVNLNTFSGEKNHFFEVAEQLFKPTIKARIYQNAVHLLPVLAKIFPKLVDFNSGHKDFFVSFVKEIINKRGGKPSNRKDFMDLMIELREQGKITKKEEDKIAELDFDDEMIAAQALVFYFAGFETSSATMSFLIHELALNQDVQDRLYKEVCEIYDKYNGNLTYEALSEMTYMEMVFDETLRKHTVAGIILRRAVADYTFPGTDISIEKGTTIMITGSGLHADPNHYSDVDKFNPDTFSPENKKNLPQGTYIPFGEGPRHCIGMRFAKVQSTIGMAVFLKNFKVEPSSKTKRQLSYCSGTPTLTSRDGIWVKISRR